MNMQTPSQLCRLHSHELPSSSTVQFAQTGRGPGVGHVPRPFHSIQSPDLTIAWWVRWTECSALYQQTHPQISLERYLWLCWEVPGIDWHFESHMHTVCRPVALDASPLFHSGLLLKNKLHAGITLVCHLLSNPLSSFMLMVSIFPQELLRLKNPTICTVSQNSRYCQRKWILEQKSRGSFKITRSDDLGKQSKEMNFSQPLTSKEWAFDTQIYILLPEIDRTSGCVLPE